MRAILFCVLLMMSVVLPAQDVEFFREDLIFSFGENSFRVEGSYYFRNPAPHPVGQVLFYPFPEPEKYGEVSEIFALELPDSTSRLLSRTKSGAMIRLEIPPNGEKVLWIGYTQQLAGNVAKYIITTTQNWEKPFEQAEYVLRVPDGMLIKSFSIPPDDSVVHDQSTLYSWKRKNFMPELDFEFAF